MGFSTLIDILGSTLIGGMLLLILLRINDAAVENTYVYGGELIVQQNLVEVVSLLEYDFRKIGFCADWQQIPDPSQAILAADSNDITFLTDLDSDGYVDTLRYFTGSPSALPGTANPRDMMLYRVENNEQPKGANLGVTQFNMLFFDAIGNVIPFPITHPSEIYTMQINITVENTDAYDENYSSAFWRQIRLAARNLRNR
ncbi:MAG: hypothetical protein U5K00_06580 [Melioribacteraceae bacterium]|nr:hypothetical protein [Melioribacteraceae bacterium]